MSEKFQAVQLLLSDARGIYIPRDFLDILNSSNWVLPEDNEHYLSDLSDPNSEYYWEAWDWVIDNAKYVDEQGNKFTLFQDGDLWAVCYEKMTNEEREFFGWEIEENNDE